MCLQVCRLVLGKIRPFKYFFVKENILKDSMYMAECECVTENKLLAFPTNMWVLKKIRKYKTVSEVYLYFGYINHTIKFGLEAGSSHTLYRFFFYRVQNRVK